MHPSCGTERRPVNQLDRDVPLSSPAVAIEIREARPEEYGKVGEVTALAYQEFARPDAVWEEYSERIVDVDDRAQRTTILVAAEEARILGSATLELETRVEREDDPSLAPNEAHVRMLGVHPGARRRGIARMLMDACIVRATEAGKTRITLNTTARMTSAQAMYESMGFERRPDRVFPDGFVLLSYEKRLG
jgi:ribosomal protein S18 acetylase RimI-like enzyme